MCGRYAASRNPDELAEEFEIEAMSGSGPGTDPASVAANYNVAPTDTAPVVFERVPRPSELAGREVADALGADATEAEEPVEAEPVRWLRLLKWGLVPSWSKDPSGGARMINARAESLFDKPAYRRAAASRRCLVPADGWYEWQVSRTATDAKGKPRKQPFLMTLAEGGELALAGIYEFWRDPARHADDPDAWLTTYAIITSAAEPGLDLVHDRMPFVMPKERWDEWLAPEVTDADTVRALLEPLAAGRFLATAISNRVNSVRNNGPELVEPIGRDELHGVLDPATGELIGGGETALF